LKENVIRYNVYNVYLFLACSMHFMKRSRNVVKKRCNNIVKRRKKVIRSTVTYTVKEFYLFNSTLFLDSFLKCFPSAFSIFARLPTLIALELTWNQIEYFSTSVNLLVFLLFALCNIRSSLNPFSDQIVKIQDFNNVCVLPQKYID